jgi:hypothetical protein
MSKSAIWLFATLECVRGYECDAGKHNATERAPCAGWSPVASDQNWTLCELVLGCCWQLTDPADNSSLVCYAPKHPKPALPSITNPVLTEMGFFGQPSANDSGYVPLEQSDFVTFGSANDLGILAQGAALGLSSFFRTQDYLVDKTQWNRSAHQGNALFPDYQARWSVLVGRLRPWVLNETITGFFIGDELTWGGLPFADLIAMTNMVGATQWATPTTTVIPKPILYYNEAAGPIVHNVDCFNDSIGYTHVPPAIDWISLDFYVSIFLREYLSFSKLTVFRSHRIRPLAMSGRTYMSCTCTPSCRAPRNARSSCPTPPPLRTSSRARRGAGAGGRFQTWWLVRASISHGLPRTAVGGSLGSTHGITAVCGGGATATTGSSGCVISPC